MCGVWREGKHKHRNKRKQKKKIIEHSLDRECVRLCVCACMPKGVADQGGCPHAKSRREPDGCC